MLQAKVEAIYYIHDWQHPIKALREQYEQIQQRLGVHQLNVVDPDEEWANNKGAQPPPKTLTANRGKNPRVKY
jgi:dCMP deaminase